MTRPIFLLGLLIVAYFSGFHAENAFSKYWEEHIIGLSGHPHWLLAKASPLNLHKAAFYMKLMEENELASHLRSFCKLATIVCSTNALLKKTMDDTTLPPIAQWNAIKVVYEDTPKEIPIQSPTKGDCHFSGSQW
ncbi:polygalacturonase non-catalytic subunit AroGP3-like [Macadamia integrifolia]|uniref:polygalacturonase non-catalytic subunit AroGP3-like n=1 Tax=Macadamia integrifolia TaxID=60698 RepID=UPI001C4FD479|nr:polygalacturonase non-catalytic subunit AroGP3-like [Macadamia integrifolia]